MREVKVFAIDRRDPGWLKRTELEKVTITPGPVVSGRERLGDAPKMKANVVRELRMRQGVAHALELSGEDFNREDIFRLAPAGGI